VLRGSYGTKKKIYVPSGSAAKKRKIWAYFGSLTFLNPYEVKGKHAPILTRFSKRSRKTLFKTTPKTILKVTLLITISFLFYRIILLIMNLMMLASWSKMSKCQQIMMWAPLQHHIQLKKIKKRKWSYFNWYSYVKWRNAQLF
jgi:hypothetical protein